MIAVAADGRPNGMAFVEFDSVESAEAAMRKDKQVMGTRCGQDRWQIQNITSNLYMDNLFGGRRGYSSG